MGGAKTGSPALFIMLLSNIITTGEEKPVMAVFLDIQLNAIEKKVLMKQAEDLYRSTNCEFFY